MIPLKLGRTVSCVGDLAKKPRISSGTLYKLCWNFVIIKRDSDKLVDSNDKY